MHWEVIRDYGDAILSGLQMTLWISAAGIAGSLVAGVGLASIEASGGALARRLVRVYVEVMGNLPIVAVLFILYFVLGADALPASVLTLVLHQGAYVAAVFTAGFRTLPREQLEGAYATGLSRWQSLRYIALPQVVRSVVPALTNQVIEVVKNSSVAMLIGVHEMTFVSQEIAQITFRGFEAGTVVTCLYVLIALALAGLAGLAQTRRTPR